MLSKDRHSLESIIESIDKITSYIKGFSNPDQLNDDQLSFDAVLMNFIIIGEMVAKLSEEFKASHNLIEWLKIKGFRNLVAHDYFGVDLDAVWDTIERDIPGLKVGIINIIKKRKKMFDEIKF